MGEVREWDWTERSLSERPERIGIDAVGGLANARLDIGMTIAQSHSSEMATECIT
jgi:hypothetical protein